jgi:RNA polymerase sigma factor (sigma-70 family)
MDLDTMLFEKCLKGDERAWSELIAKYQRLIFSVARTLCKEPADASDVFQHVCLELFQRLGNLRQVETLPAWLITVTRRQCYTVLNSRKYNVQLEDDWVEIENRLEQIEKEHAVERALEQVSERCRQLLNLLYFDPSGPSYAEIADRIKMPASSIGPTRARCLEKLKTLL